LRILVTGGAGFIGSNFVEYMMSRHPSYSITVFDALTYASNPDTIKQFMKNRDFKFIKGDILDMPLVEKAVKGHDWIVHFAAETHVDRSILGPAAFIETNIKGTFNLLEASRKSGVKKFLQISTDEVYGSVARGRSRESDPLDPTSPYSASKTSADLLALSYYKTFSLPVLITRSSNNFGPRQHPEKFIPLFITNAIEVKPLPLYGDGKNVRNWIYVEDNCAGIDTVLHKGAPGEIYNVGGDTEEANLKVAKCILESFCVKESLIRHVKDRLAHDRRYALDSSKLKKLGWKPANTFEQGLAHTIKWYANNTNWWLKLKKGAFREYYRKNYKDRP
jgi:dTDP-glucose 4,6-dehydratase